LDDALPPVGRWAVRGSWLVLALAAAAGGWASTVEYETTVRAPGWMRPVGETRSLRSPLDGIVSAIQVQENQSVMVGEVVVELEAGASTRRWDQTAQRQQVRLAIARSEQALQRQEQQAVALAQQIISTATAATATAESASDKPAIGAQSPNEPPTDRLSTDRLSTDRLSTDRPSTDHPPTDRAFANQASADRALADGLYETAAALDGLAAAQHPQAVAWRSQWLEGLAQRDRLIRQIQADREWLAAPQTDLERGALRSPVTGRVLSLAVRSLGEPVQAGQTVATLVPTAEPPRVILAVPSEAIAPVQVGQPVRLQVAAYPYTDYGWVEGSVQAIAPDATFGGVPEFSGVPDFSGERGPTAGSRAYAVAVQLNQATVSQGDRRYPLQPGMNVQGDIVTGRTTLLDTWLRKARLLRSP
jgi:multidrug efflux pump subunit AcrA (membrane-fusion protein)